MVEDGRLTGVYNLVIADEYDLFDHRVPTTEFEAMLRDQDVPQEICVVGLAETYENDNVRRLRRAMEGAADSLESENPLPTIQFAVEGSFQRRSRDFELQTDDDLYRLSRVFGPQIERRSSDWLTAPF